MELGERIARLESEVVYLKERDAALNGSIQRTEAKLDALNNRFTTILGSVVASLVLLMLNLVIQWAQKGGPLQ